MKYPRFGGDVMRHDTWSLRRKVYESIRHFCATPSLVRLVLDPDVSLRLFLTKHSITESYVSWFVNRTRGWRRIDLQTWRSQHGSTRGRKSLQ